MNYPLALLFGKVALAFVGVALVYHLLDATLRRLRRRDASAAVCDRVARAVALARASHPYLASLISLAAAYHVYVMWMTHGLNPKMWSGLLLSLAVAFMANTGWALKLFPGRGRLRLAHRIGTVILLIFAAIHFFI
jgi:hypothetical protein